MVILSGDVIYGTTFRLTLRAEESVAEEEVTERQAMGGEGPQLKAKHV